MFNPQQNSDYLLPFLTDVSNFVGKRWSFRIIWEMRHNKKMRFQELQDSLVGISSSTLSETLKNLQNEKLISRHSHGDYPPYKVEYMITKKGMDLLIASSSLVKWAITKRMDLNPTSS